jgi:hypothetical protein
LKSADWVKRFDKTKQEEFLKAYAEETAKLITERTAKSGVVTLRDGKTKVDTKYGATEGVLREQRQKWAAVCNKLNDSSLTTNLFDTLIMGTHLPDVITSLKAHAEHTVKESDKVQPVEKGVAGRKLADAATA